MRPRRPGTDRRRRAERGQATVEFALCLPVVALLLALVIQVALIVRGQILVVEAAREGARAASREPRADVADRAARSVPGLDGARLAVDLRRSGGDEPTVEVIVDYRAPTDVALIGRFLPEPHLTARVAIRVEPGADP